MSASPRPIMISEKLLVTIPVALIVSLVLAAVAATRGWSLLAQRIETATVRATSAQQTTVAQEVRLREVENAQLRMANDIGWIRRTMEEDRRPGAGR